MPPLFVILAIRSSDHQFRLWIPLFILWLLLLPLFILLLPLVIVAEIVFTVIGFRFHPLTILAACAGLISALKGLRVLVDSKSGNAKVHINII